ncbi:MAG: hypothetical protein WC865_16355 [Bacteroidales bacterium]
MTGGRVNAGFGMPEKHRRKTGTSLVFLFQQFRERHPVVRQMLVNARQVSEIGDGIMLAVRSGLLAGIAAKNGQVPLYDSQVEKFLWNRMKSQRQTISLITCLPFLISVVAWLGRFAWFRTGIRKWIW